MDATKERLAEIADQIRSASTNSALHYSLMQEEKYIYQMMALEQRIVTTERDLASEKRVRATGCTKLQIQGATGQEQPYLQNAKEVVLNMIEVSVEKTVELSIKLSLLKNDKSSLIAKRAAERVTGH
jgi:hypothetical protein